MSAHLVVFVKNPVPGTVKTRLQARYTPEQAADFYRAFILDTLAAARTVPADQFHIAYTPAEAEADIQNLCGPGWTYVPQIAADLGERMYAAARHCFQLGAARVVIVGTDVPSLPPAHIRQAFDILSRKDIVLGPSTDGGYYLVGLSQPIPSIFQHIRWSTAGVFAQTLDRAESAGLQMGLVPPWYDIDTPEELDFLAVHVRARTLAEGIQALPHTAASLSRLT